MVHLMGRCDRCSSWGPLYAVPTGYLREDYCCRVCAERAQKGGDKR